MTLTLLILVLGYIFLGAALLFLLGTLFID
jgi:hypothetical protein